MNGDDEMKLLRQRLATSRGNLHEAERAYYGDLVTALAARYEARLDEEEERLEARDTWIRCEDLLPPANESVWVSGYDGLIEEVPPPDDDGFRYVTIGIRDHADKDSGKVYWGDELHCDSDGNREPLWHVTHWKPFKMPDPPPEEGDE